MLSLPVVIINDAVSDTREGHDDRACAEEYEQKAIAAMKTFES
jgi:hypothetical protein